MKRQAFPLHPAQQDVFFDQLVNPESPHYNIGGYIQLKGLLDKEKFFETINTAPKYFDAFKMRFDKKAEEAIGFVDHEFEHLELSELDFSQLANAREGALNWMQDRFNTPFLIEEDSLLFEHALIKITEDEHWFFCRYHHLITDGYGFTVWVNYVGKKYKSLVDNEDIHLSYPSYLEEAAKASEYYKSAEYENDGKYWKERITERPQKLLQKRYHRSDSSTEKSGTFILEISEEQRRLFEDIQTSTKLSLQQLTIAALVIYFGKTTTAQEFLFGIPLHKRSSKRIRSIYGMFSGFLPVKCTYHKDDLLIDLLREISQTQKKDYRHQNYLIGDLSRHLKVNTQEGYLTEVIVNYEPLNFDVVFGEELKAKVLRLSNQYEVNPLQLVWREYGSERPLQLHIHYRNEYFPSAEVELLAERVIYILNQFQAGLSENIGAINIIPSSELRSIIASNDTTVPYPKDKTIVDLFEDQVEKTPDAIAVVFEEEELSYRELNKRSNQLGHYLQSIGVRAEVLVPICIERSVEMIVGILGILKAGGAYVPIDPEYPGERIGYMLEDAGASVIVTSKRSKEKIGLKEGVAVIPIDADWSEISKQPSSNPGSASTRDNLAYVIYTSGSTGRPKGVMIEHRNTFSFIKWCHSEFSSSNFNIVYASTSLCFDLSVYEIFYPLTIGKKVRVIESSLSLGKHLSKDNSVLINTVPVVVDSLIKGRADFSNVSVINMAGEPIPLDVQQALDTEKIEVRNLYGPTEDTTYSTVYKITKTDGISIGKPITNSRIYILNEENQLVPKGVAGEICISGDGLARGYLNRLDLTAEKFVRDPFSHQEGARMYKTGDLGRRLADGNIEFLGRKDDQVKIRGYRIELGEIESVVLQSGVVSQAVVVAKEDGEGNRRLIGYAVSEGLLDRDAVTAYLQSRLPEYMIPAVWVELDQMPLTSSGKIDRKGLPAADLSVLSSKQYVAPRAETEKKLATMWEELLQVDRVGIYDNFFELGGHSLLAMRLMSLIRKEFELDIAIKELFVHPTIAEFSGYLHLQDKGLLVPAIKVQQREGRLPLSFSQERLWFIDKLEGSVEYHLPAVLRLKGKLNKAALSYSLQQIVERHEVLRTVYQEDEGRAYQKINESTGWQLSEMDRSSVYSKDAPGLKRLVEGFINAPFNLAKDYMLRAALMELGYQEHLLVVTLHHIASDGWSISVILKELAELYSSFDEVRKAVLPALPLQYADYSIWQRNYLQGDLLEQKVSYWRDKLKGVSILQLPTDYKRPSVQSTKGGSKVFSVDKQVSAGIDKLSRSNGATLFMTLLTGFKVLLHRYSGQEDVCVGTAVSGRQYQELEGLTGFFVNTLALRSEVRSEATFTELLQEVRATTMEAFGHQEVPFEKVVEVVVKERDLSRSPLIQVMFVLQNTPEVPELKFKEVELSSEGYENSTSKFDLILSIRENENGLNGLVEYSTDLYKPETIERMIGHYQELLRSAIKSPEKKTGELPMLSKAEEQQLLVEFNDTKVDYPKDKTIVDLFEDQVEKTPESVAVVFEEVELSYRELNERSNRLGHYLQSKGVGAEVLVPICIERGIEMIIGILGILKAGGAYVPIDAEYPAERIRYIIEDTKAKLVVTGKAVHTSIPVIAGVNVIELESHQAAINEQIAENLARAAAPNNLAYVIYTSGSTGAPKGAMIEHINVVRLFITDTAIYDFNETDVWTLFHSFSFDFSVWEMFGALFYGGKIVVVPKEVTRDARLFLELLEREKVTVVNQTPSAFYVLQDKLLDHVPDLEVRYVIFGGEELNSAKLYLWKQQYCDCRLINMYGITETTVHVTYQQIDAKIIEKGSSIVGKPIPTTTCYILNEEQTVVPIGIWGELFVGGAGVSRGYLNLPDLTNERFIRNPFDQEVGSTLYKTGDLGRWLEDGTIEYNGRKDEQVKIRGYRIELGEIENAVLQSGLVTQVSVVSKVDRNGNKRLVGYVVSEGDFNKEALVTILYNKLPEYMVPAIWVTLQKIPLTSNGKIDRKALPNPDVSEQLRTTFIAPRSENEVKLVQIWQDLLGVEHIGIEDNFFELGGDSILSIQVISRANRAGMNLRPKDIFLHQTIRRLSKAIEDEGDETVVTGEQRILTGAAGLTPIQHWYLHTETGNVSHYNQSILLSIDKAITHEQLSEVVKELINHHDALRFKYYQQDGQWHQEYSSEAIVPVENITLIEGDIQSAITRIADAHQQTLNIEKGVIIRVVLIQTPPGEIANKIFIVVHHLAIDGVSWRILLEDIEQLLTQITGNQKTDLGSKSLSYRQWYNILEQYGRGSALKQSAYWQQAVESFKPLKTDKYSAGVVKLKDTRIYRVQLELEQTRKLIQDVPMVYHTDINDILLAALAKTLCDWSNTNKIVIGLEGHGREDIAEDIDISRTVGWFTTLFPLSLQIGSADNNDALVKTVKEQLRAVPDKGIGFGVLKYINNDKDFQINKCWDVVFNYLGQLDSSLKTSKWLKGNSQETGSERNEELVINEKLSINCLVLSGKLVFDWRYSCKHFSEETIKVISRSYISNLTVLVNHCIAQKSSSGVVFTPSDYGIGGDVNYKELDKFLEEPYKGMPRKTQIEGLYRLSGLQQGMLFHSLYNTASEVYIEQLSFDLVSPNTKIIGLSWHSILQNHTILRSAFYQQAFSIPVQVVYNEVQLLIEDIDYRGMSEAEQVAAIDKYKAADRRKGFDFEAAPLMRLTLFRLGDDRYRLVWTTHHILFDGWSLQIVMEEFLSTYEALTTEKKIEPIGIDRYEDYIRYIENLDKHAEERYWTGYLQEVTQGTLLPFIQSSAQRTKGEGTYESVSLKLTAAATTQIQDYAQNNHLTVNTIMQGVWSYLLHSYSGKNNVVFGIVVSGRPDDLPNVEHRVGMYINTLPFHSCQHSKKRVVEWLEHFQQNQVLSRQYQYTDLSQIQRWTGMQGDFFDTLLVFENYPLSKVLSSKEWSLKIENVLVDEQTNYPLTIVITSGEQIDIKFSYNSDLLLHEYIVEIQNHFGHVLSQIINNPFGKVNDLKVLTAKEEQQLLTAFNKTTVEYPQNPIITELFKEQVLQTPNATAVVFEDKKLSYRQLNERSNKLARFLISKGAQKNAFVPICIERSAELIVGILAILKAGGAYVPIDPYYPEERIEFMLEDTRAAIILSSKYSRTKLRHLKGVEIIDIDADSADIIAQSADDLEIGSDPHDLAYIIYTSGSTGTPKGVLIEHGNVVSLVKNVDNVSLSKNDILLSTGSPSFDATTFEYWGMLLNGGQLVLCTDERLLKTDLLKNEIRSRGVNKMWFTSSWFNQLVENDSSIFETLECILVGGEKLSEQHINRVVETYPFIKIINGYGPTENTTFSSTYTITQAVTNCAGVPIGIPLNNRTAYIVDRKGHLVPIGITGEIWLGGLGLSRGYLNQPELTAQKFVKNPFTTDKRQKLYRTGDLGRWLPDGNIDYVGRIDEQVKIRGHRIELGEIESVLLQSGLVKHVVVVAIVSEKGNNPHLAGYVVVSEGVFEKEAIIAYLRSRLPEYMIPLVWVELDHIPLTPNGKIDKRALPDIDRTALSNKAFVAPSNDLEKKLASIWQNLLNVEKIGIHDNFFELGGHSLMAMRVASEIRNQLKVEVNIKDLFNYITIEELSKYVAVQNSDPLNIDSDEFELLIM